MVRSMYSGVSGMRVHQTAMDTIGNNIANVNTYGFKGSRTTFADIYYQSLRGASAASATRGGVNASQVGVGSQVRSVDVMMTRSSFTQTDMGMDVAIDGEGFLQVMDANGNKFYTRAGQLLFDANGNLVDSKGNFVLGTNGETFGVDPGSNKIQVALGSVNPTAASVEQTIDDVIWRINTTENTDEGNVGISFVPDSSMAANEPCKAEVTDSGIIVRLNGNMVFKSDAELSKAVNDAIQSASRDLIQGPHPAGDFTISSEGLNWGSGITGEELCNTSKKVVPGSITGLNGDLKGYSIVSYGSEFGSDPAVLTATDGTITPTTTISTDTPKKPATMEIEMELNGITYSGKMDKIPDGSSKLILYKNGDPTSKDYVEVKVPNMSEYFNSDKTDFATNTNVTPNAPYTDADLPIVANMSKTTGDPPVTDNSLIIKASKIPESHSLSSQAFTLTGGTKGGPQGVDSLTGVSIGTDGVITGHHENLGDVTIGRIDLAVFVNPSGLTSAGGTYFTTSPNSGTMNLVKPGMGGSGQVVAGSLELSNVDLSREFTDMIKTQRGYQANSRIITVTDTMLEELVNLKR